MILDGDGCNPANSSDGQTFYKTSGLYGDAEGKIKKKKYAANHGKGLGQMIHYVCKYTPVELLNAFGEECRTGGNAGELLKCRIRSHTQICAVWEICDSGSSGRKG